MITGLTPAPVAVTDGERVRLSAAGEHRRGEFRCVDCAHTVTVCRELPTCSMCGGERWQPISWRPFARALGTLQPE